MSMIRAITVTALTILAGGCMQPPLETSTGSIFVPEASYPMWSWDTVQEYKMFGDEHLLTDDEVERIAALSNFIAIEKQHGGADLDSAELGAKHEARRFKAINPDIKVLFYFNGAIAYEFTSYTQNFSPKPDRMSEQQKEDLLLFDVKKNEYHTIHNGHRYAWDILKPTFRTWWSETVGKAVRETGTDGVFWDQMHGWNYLRWDRRETVAEAHVLLQKMATTMIGEDRILLCNNAAHRQEFIENCDAVMYEHHKPGQYRENFQRYVDDWDQMLAVANAGKINVYRWPVNRKGTKFEKSDHRVIGGTANHDEVAEIAKARITFPLACFLIGAQPYSYFMLSWGWGTYTGALVDFPEMKRPLGPPQGAYERESEDKWIFTRAFKHADVWVDLAKEEARITWK
ncbi:MAG: hypothetical protein HN341_01385 [Verrucomicrobia bacterium]|jgi:hypothetical protein|nr:hypothetical protein [Verrucomicrobiota bacterium]